MDAILSIIIGEILTIISTMYAYLVDLADKHMMIALK